MIDQNLTKIMTNWTEAEWKEAGTIEAELNAKLSEGLTEDAAMTVVHALMAMRKVPEFKSATPGGVFDTALRLGMVELVKQACPGAARAARSKGKLAGRGVR